MNNFREEWIIIIIMEVGSHQQMHMPFLPIRTETPNVRSDNECFAFVHFHKSCFLSSKTTICNPLSCHSNSSQSLCEKDTIRHPWLPPPSPTLLVLQLRFTGSLTYAEQTVAMPFSSRRMQIADVFPSTTAAWTISSEFMCVFLSVCVCVCEAEHSKLSTCKIFCAWICWKVAVAGKKLDGDKTKKKNATHKSISKKFTLPTSGHKVSFETWREWMWMVANRQRQWIYYYLLCVNRERDARSNSHWFNTFQAPPSSSVSLHSRRVEYSAVFHWRFSAWIEHAQPLEVTTRLLCLRVAQPNRNQSSID